LSEFLTVFLLVALLACVRELLQWNDNRKLRRADERRREEAARAARLAEEAREQREREEAAAARSELERTMKDYFEISHRKAIQDRLREIEERD
jgi:uncharacterized protein YlxW (UPF0749 family)